MSHPEKQVTGDWIPRWRLRKLRQPKMKLTLFKWAVLRKRTGGGMWGLHKSYSQGKVDHLILALRLQGPERVTAVRFVAVLLLGGRFQEQPRSELRKLRRAVHQAAWGAPMGNHFSLARVLKVVFRTTPL